MSHRVQKVIEFLRRSEKAASLYHDWDWSMPFEMLPHLSRQDLVRVPLSHRRYKDASSLVKIVHGNEGTFLSEWAFEDIAREEFGPLGKRPLVYMSDPHEAVEKSMWCYERGVVPLIGEKDPDVAAYGARKYQIDSLITDPEALTKLGAYLRSRTAPLASMVVVADAFDTGSLIACAPYAETIRLVLALPETGALAQATLAPKPSFAPLPDCLMENIDGVLVVTKLRELVTPLVRYRSGLLTDMLTWTT